MTDYANITRHQLNILRYSLRLFILGLALLSLSGCVNLNCTRLEGLLGGKTNLVTFSYKIAEDLVEQAMPPLTPMHPEMPVLVTTFVSNSDLEKTGSFGRLLQEHITSRLVQLGYTVRELKMANNLYIEQQSGETILTRDLSELTPNLQAQAIAVGTFTRTNRILYLSTRLINPSNNNIISSNDYKLCMDDDILAMFGLQRYMDNTNSITEPSQPILNKIL
ncbi:MAG: TolB-like protein [Desulforhopalus sp.]|jgi:TolB-like protein